GLTLNTMTLGGFAVALGVLVDDAIIGIENILRRLRENGQLADPKLRLEVVLEATLEVRGPVIYATAVVVAVFLPELFTSSVQGHFVGPLALAFIFAVSASLLVAMTSTPALCALFLRRHDARPEARWLLLLKAWQARAVHGVAAHFRLVGAMLIGLVIAALAALPFLGGTFMPDFREGHFVMQVSSSITGTSLFHAGHGHTRQRGGAGAALRAEHRAAGGPRRTGGRYLGSASQRIPRRIEGGCEGRSECCRTGVAQDIGGLPRHPKRGRDLSGRSHQLEFER